MAVILVYLPVDLYRRPNKQAYHFIKVVETRGYCKAINIVERNVGHSAVYFKQELYH